MIGIAVAIYEKKDYCKYLRACRSWNSSDTLRTLLLRTQYINKNLFWFFFLFISMRALSLSLSTTTEQKKNEINKNRKKNG